MSKLPKEIEERFDELYSCIKCIPIPHIESRQGVNLGLENIKSFIATILKEEMERIIGEIKKFKIMEGSVIDKLEEKSEMQRVTNLLNENLEIGYRQACMDIINLIKEDK